MGKWVFLVDVVFVPVADYGKLEAMCLNNNVILLLFSKIAIMGTGRVVNHELHSPSALCTLLVEYNNFEFIQRLNTHIHVNKYMQRTKHEG